MKHPTAIVYKGRKYWLQKTGRYYSDGNKEAVERLLHRAIWREHNGPIPKGMFVHHINGDWTDNRIVNLALMLPGEHTRMHMLECHKDPKFYEQSIRGLEKARSAAAAWHRDPSNRDAHVEAAKKGWADREPAQARCQQCGKEFPTFTPNFAKKCPKCRNSKYLKDPKKFIERTCCVCGKAFSVLKYRGTTHCSFECRAVTISRTRHDRRN